MQRDAAVGGLRRDRAERPGDLQVAVGEPGVDVRAGLADLHGPVRRLEDGVAGDRADADLPVVGGDLDRAVRGADGRVAVPGTQPQVAGGLDVDRSHRALDAGGAEPTDRVDAAHRALGGEPRAGGHLDAHVDRLARADEAEPRLRTGDREHPRGEVDRGLLRAAAVDGLRRVGRRDRHDGVGAVARDDVDGAHRQVDGDVDRGGRGVRGHGDACLPRGVFVRPRGFAWLVGVWAGWSSGPSRRSCRRCAGAAARIVVAWAGVRRRPPAPARC